MQAALISFMLFVLPTSTLMYLIGFMVQRSKERETMQIRQVSNALHRKT